MKMDGNRDGVPCEQQWCKAAAERGLTSAQAAQRGHQAFALAALGRQCRPGGR